MMILCDCPSCPRREGQTWCVCGIHWCHCRSEAHTRGIVATCEFRNEPPACLLPLAEARQAASKAAGWTMP